MKITELKREDYEQVEVNSSRWLSLDNLKNEYWKDIKDFEGLYQVSNYGRVKALTRKVKSTIKHNDFITKQECILHQYKKHGKYWGVALCKNGKHYNKQVHILVAKAFIPNPYNKPCVDHDKPVEKDYCNNCVYNLRWATHKENSQHCVELGRNYKDLRYTKRGREHWGAKAIIQYDLEGNFIKQWYCIKDIERELGFKHTCISNNLHNRSETSYGYKWKYGIYKKER